MSAASRQTTSLTSTRETTPKICILDDAATRADQMVKHSTPEPQLRVRLEVLEAGNRGAD